MTTSLCPRDDEPLLLLKGGLILVAALIGFLKMQLQFFDMRRREVSLRKVHGAKRKDIALLFGSLYLWLIAVASVLSVPLMLMFNTLLQDWGRQENVPSDLISPITPILLSIGITSLVILVVVSLHVATVMRQKPADIIAKE